MIEPSMTSIPEVSEALDASIPTFTSPLHAEVDRRDSFSVDSSFSFRRPSAQSTFSLDTISPAASVTSFQNHQSPSASMANFHLNHSPNISVASFHHSQPANGLAQFHQAHSPNASMNHFHSPSASVASFQNHHLSSSPSIPNFHHNQSQSPTHGMTNFQLQQPSSIPNLMSQDVAMDLGGMGFTTHGMGQGNNLKMESGTYPTPDFYAPAQHQHQHLNRVASHSSLEGALGGFYMA